MNGIEEESVLLEKPIAAQKKDIVDLVGDCLADQGFEISPSRRNKLREQLLRLSEGRVRYRVGDEVMGEDELSFRVSNSVERYSDFGDNQQKGEVFEQTVFVARTILWMAEEKKWKLDLDQLIDGVVDGMMGYKSAVIEGEQRMNMLLEEVERVADEEGITDEDDMNVVTAVKDLVKVSEVMGIYISRKQLKEMMIKVHTDDFKLDESWGRNTKRNVAIGAVEIGKLFPTDSHDEIKDRTDALVSALHLLALAEISLKRSQVEEIIKHLDGTMCNWGEEVGK